MRAFLARVEQGESVLEVETRRLNRDGVPVEVQLSLLPYREEPGQSYFLEVTEDIRARVRLRENLLEIEKLTTIGRMAAGTAHHLNTPLATMLLRVQMMRNRSRPAPAAADLDILESGLRFCGYFVERLRTFSRPPPLVKRPEEVRHTIQSVVDFFSPSLMVRHAGIVLDVAGADGLKVEADRNLLEALFLILLSNALDAIEDRGSITVRCRGLSESVVEVQVADQGRGIAPADLPRVFEPFFTTKGPGKGTGLGLAIARNIVLAHGGSIRLDSAPERGTTVSVELPVYREQAGGTPA
jgi:signal transduction histidine kinase